MIDKDNIIYLPIFTCSLLNKSNQNTLLVFSNFLYLEFVYSGFRLNLHNIKLPVVASLMCKSTYCYLNCKKKLSRVFFFLLSSLFRCLNIWVGTLYIVSKFVI